VSRRSPRRALPLRSEEWIAGAYLVAVVLLFAARGLPFSWGRMALEYGKFLAAVTAVALPIWLVARLPPLRRFRLADRSATRDLGELARSLLALLAVLVPYTNLKSRLAVLRPRLFDAPLLDLDAALHFGGGDWIGWLLGFAADPASARRLGTIYFFAWAALALPFGVAFARAGGAAVRRILAALGLAYAAGSLVYLALPALGPAFAWRPRYAAVLDGSVSFAVQESMLAAMLRILGEPAAAAIPFFGIAAMPSLHLATTAIGLFAAWRWCRPLLVLLVPWNLAIAWSALVLGWHYAVDFYPGILLAGGAWWAAGRLTARPPPPGAG
jgi:hypothetical protein